MSRRRIALAATLAVLVLAGPGPAEPVPAGERGVTYYVNRNAQDSGDHEVHTTTCKHGAKESNRLYLGTFTSCQDAVREAKKHYRQSDGCYHCARACDHG